MNGNRLAGIAWLEAASTPGSERKALECRERAEHCRLNAENAQSAYEQAAWLDLGDDWIMLAEAFEQEDSPKWKH